MKCPLSRLAVFANSNPDFVFRSDADDCQEENCAWWDENSERCAVLMVAVDMDRAVSVVNDLCLNLDAQLGNLNENLIKR